MKRLIFFTIIAMIAFTGCNKLDIAKDTPKCIVNKINDFNKDADCDDPNVKEYTFQGGSVYVFDPGTCGADMTSAVFDSDCTGLGQLGGFAGNTTINGENFSSAVFVKTIWAK
jgi:hypothetical protein